MAKELAGYRPVILGQTTPVVKALAREMPTSPIVFVTVSDPIGSGFAGSLARPGGDVTGSRSTIPHSVANGSNY